MSLHIRSIALLSALAATTVFAQTTSITPLIDQRYNYPNLPYQVDPNPTGRGPQFGYNLCNSTTETQTSNCQTAFVNSIDDFCLWGPPDANSTIADTEAETVAWCTKSGHGTRIIPDGTLQGVQFLIAPNYILVAVVLNQVNVDIQSGDDGGELDPRGADLRGNPLGGLMFSTGFTGNTSIGQIINWQNFMGSNVACMKICNPSVDNNLAWCNNIYDETGCDFVAPAAYESGVFEVCESDNMDPVGVYTGSDGKTSTFSQPAVVTSLPSVRTPSSSNCTPYSSTDLYAAGASVTPSSGANTATTTSGVTNTASVSGSTKVSSSTTKATGSTSLTSTAKSTSTSNAAMKAHGAVSGLNVGPFMAVAFSVLAGLGAVIVGM